VPGGLTDGSHVIEVTASDGGTATVTIRIDTSPPQITSVLSPAANPAGWRNAAVTATYSCADTGSGIASCPPPQSTGTQEGTAVVLSGTSTNGAGLSTTATDTVKVDLTAPSVPVVTLDPASRLVTVTTNLTATTSETLSG